MSYILDALRRADSERERDRTAVPGLHAQPIAQVADDDDRPGRSTPWIGIGLGVMVLLLAVIAWTLLSRDNAPEALPPAAPPPAAAPPVAAVPAAPASAAQTPPPIAPPVVQAAPPTPRAAAPEPRRAAASAAKAAAKPTPATASAAASAPTQMQPVYAQKDLPEEIRRALPQLSVGGSIYSESAANRFVIINGQLFHENDVLAPDLTLRQIKLKSAVLEFRGYRYEIGY